MDSLDRCMTTLHVEEVETHRPGFRPPGPDPMPGRLLGILRHEALELGLGLLMLEMGRPSPRKDPSELCPGIRGAHVDDPHRLDARLRRLDAEWARSLAAFYAAPEFPLSGNDEVPIKGIGMGFDFDPLAATSDHRQRRRPCRDDPHVVLQLRHILLRRRFLRERPWQHELGFEYRTAACDTTVEGRRHPPEGRMAGPLLDVRDDPPSIGLVPAPVELLSGKAELHNQIAGQVLGLNFASFFPPQPQQGGLVSSRDDPGIRAADAA
jgi:hypothetical protein